MTSSRETASSRQALYGAAQERLRAEVERLNSELSKRDLEAANALRERFIGEMTVMFVSLLVGFGLGYWVGG